MPSLLDDERRKIAVTLFPDSPSQQRKGTEVWTELQVSLSGVLRDIPKKTAAKQTAFDDGFGCL